MGPSWLHVAVLALLAGPAGGGVGAEVLVALIPGSRGAPRVDANACQPDPAMTTAAAGRARATSAEGVDNRGTQTARQRSIPVPDAVASVRGRSFCGIEGCRKRSTFMATVNVTGTITVRFFCAEHRTTDASPKPGRLRCEFDGEAGERCDRWPSYASDDEKRPRFCRTHAPSGATYRKARLCEVQGCVAQPSFGLAGGGMMNRCRAHSLRGQVDYRAMRCVAQGCASRPSFWVPPPHGGGNASGGDEGGEGGRRRGATLRYCAMHRPVGATRSAGHRCRHPGCATVPTFGFVGTGWGRMGKAVACVKHRTAGDVDVVNAHCTAVSCTRRVAGVRAGLAGADSGGGEREGAAGLEGHERLCRRHAHVRPADKESVDAGGAGVSEGGDGWAGEKSAPLLCLFMGGGRCGAAATHGDPESGVPLFCESHGAPFHINTSRWHEGCEPSLVKAKIKRSGIVRNLYALAVAEGEPAWGGWTEGSDERKSMLETHLGTDGE